MMFRSVLLCAMVALMATAVVGANPFDAAPAAKQVDIAAPASTINVQSASAMPPNTPLVASKPTEVAATLLEKGSKQKTSKSSASKKSKGHAFNSAFLSSLQREMDRVKEAQDLAEIRHQARKTVKAAGGKVSSKKGTETEADAVKAAARVIIANKLARVLSTSKATLIAAEKGRLTMAQLEALNQKENKKADVTNKKKAIKTVTKKAGNKKNQIAGKGKKPLTQAEKLAPYLQHAETLIAKVKPGSINPSAAENRARDEAETKKKLAARLLEQGPVNDETAKAHAEAAATATASTAASTKIQSLKAAVAAATPAAASLLEVPEGDGHQEFLLKTVQAVQAIDAGKQHHGQVDANGKLCPQCDPIVYNHDSPLSDDDKKLLQKQHEAFPVHDTPLLGQRTLDVAQLTVEDADLAKQTLLNKYPVAESLLQLSMRN